MKQKSYNFFCICLLIVFIVLLAAFIIREYNYKKLVKNQTNEITKIIREAISKQSNLDMLLPEIILVKGDTSTEQISNKIKEDIISILKQYYLNMSNKNKIDFKPYFIQNFKEKINGKYLLTQRQLKELKGHIEYLVEQVNKAVEATKEELNRDIDRLNFWITIWIGAIALIVTIVPLYMNYEASKNIYIATKKSIDAEKKSNDAIDKIDEVKNDVDTANNKSKEAKKLAEKALARSDKIERLLDIIKTIERLDSDYKKAILYYRKKDIKKYLIISLKSIQKKLSISIDLHDNDLIIDTIGDLAISLQSISLLKYFDHSETRILNELSFKISNYSTGEKNKEEYENLLNDCSIIINKLSN